MTNIMGVADHARTTRLLSAVADAMRRYEAMPPEAKAAMWKAQRESWMRAFAPCEHGDYDWETCSECLAGFAAQKAGE